MIIFFVPKLIEGRLEQIEMTSRYIIYDGSKDNKHPNKIILYEDQLIGALDFNTKIITWFADSVVFYYKSASSYIPMKNYKFLRAITILNDYIMVLEDRGDYMVRYFGGYRYQKKHEMTQNIGVTALRFYERCYKRELCDLRDANFGIDLVARYRRRGIRLNNHYTDIRIRCLE